MTSVTFFGNPRPLGFFERLFKREQQAPTAEPEVRGSTPIEVDGEVDNSVILLQRINELVGMTGVELFASRIYQLYRQVVDDTTRHSVETLDQTSESPLTDHYDFLIMAQWLEDVLPQDIRQKLLSMHIALDDLEEKIGTLSQQRWEKLRMWSKGHD
ncbi:hypothetical protein LUCX_22 [Xanthomonas phage vB_XciM_LucasX]|nr:hypothetical protein LUCX_22 [Xanthomonas phage vB_XciM_LucasX]